jgi:hypothetical protein
MTTTVRGGRVPAGIIMTDPRRSPIPLRSRQASTVAAQGKSTGTTHAGMISRASPSSQYPLSGMPTNMLFRSILIASVSSTRLLLIPSLRLLAFLEKPNRSFLLNVDRNPVLHAILKKTVYNQFCAGETLKETSTCVRLLNDLGFRGVILTYAKELIHNPKSAALCSGSEQQEAEDRRETPNYNVIIEEWRAGTSETVDMIEKGDILAIK